MNMTLIRLTPPGDAVRSSQYPYPRRDPSPDPLSPEIVADILWAVAVPADGLEHIRARSGPDRQIDIAIFRRTAPTSDSHQSCLALCQRAIDTAPALAGWTAQLLHTPHPTPPTGTDP